MTGFPNTLRKLREAAGLSQAALAKLIGGHQSHVSDWEKPPDNPKYRQIPMDKAILAAGALDCPLWKLRPDVLPKDSLDPLAEGLSEQDKTEVRNFINFKHEQRRSSP